MRPFNVYLCNSFSLSMLENTSGELKYREINTEELKEKIHQGFISAIGHEATAKLVSELTGIDVPMNRIMVKAKPYDYIIVVQIMIRLEEGEILSLQEIQELLEQGKIKFFLVDILK